MMAAATTSETAHLWLLVPAVSLIAPVLVAARRIFLQVRAGSPARIAAAAAKH